MKSKIQYSNLYSSANIQRTESKEYCIVFVHGFSESEACWTDIANRLGKSANVVTYDCAGHGNNATLWPQVTFDVYVDQLGTLVRHLKEKENFQQIILAGHSQGAAIVAQHTIQNPDNINGLMLISPFFRVDSPLRAIWTNFIQLIEQSDMRRFWDLNSSLLLGPKSGSWLHLREESIQQRLDFFDQEQLKVLINALLNVSVTGDFSRLRNKLIYLIHGEYDVMFPNYYSKEILQLIPGAKYTEIENASHLLVELEPNVSQLLLEIIDDKKQCRRCCGSYGKEK